MNNLLRCQNNHLFSTRRYGSKCPYCSIESTSREQEDIKKRLNKDGSIRLLDMEEKVLSIIREKLFMNRKIYLLTMK